MVYICSVLGGQGVNAVIVLLVNLQDWGISHLTIIYHLNLLTES